MPSFLVNTKGIWVCLVCSKQNDKACSWHFNSSKDCLLYCMSGSCQIAWINKALKIITVICLNTIIYRQNNEFTCKYKHIKWCVMYGEYFSVPKKRTSLLLVHICDLMDSTDLLSINVKYWMEFKYGDRKTFYNLLHLLNNEMYVLYLYKGKMGQTKHIQDKKC